MLWLARKGGDEIKEESVLHRLWRQVWVFAKTLCYYASKKGEDPSKFVDESWEDISGFAQIWIIPPAEKGASKLLAIVKPSTDRMS